MLKIINPDSKTPQIVATEGYLHRKGDSSYSKMRKCFLFPGETIDDFEGLVAPAPKPLTDEEVELNAKRNRMDEILSELQSMDYLTSKYIDGEDMSAYGDWQEKRKALREEYRKLDSELNSVQPE